MLRVGEGESSRVSDSDALKWPKVNPQQTLPSRRHQQLSRKSEREARRSNSANPRCRETGSERLSHLPKDTDSAQHSQDEKPGLPPDL